MIKSGSDYVGRMSVTDPESEIWFQFFAYQPCAVCISSVRRDGLID